HTGFAQQRRQRPCPRLQGCSTPPRRRNRRDEDSDPQEGPAEQAVRAEGGMNILRLFRSNPSAPVARERLQILLEYERGQNGKPDLAAILRDEILDVVRRHVSIDSDRVQVKLDRQDGMSTLAVDIKIPYAANG